MVGPMTERFVWILFSVIVSITQFSNFWVMSYGNLKHILDVFSFHISVFNNIFVIKYTLRDPLVRSVVTFDILFYFIFPPLTIFSLTHKHKPTNMCIHKKKKKKAVFKKTHPITPPYTPERWVLFTDDGLDEARELLKFLWVWICVLGEMGVVATVIVVVVTVFFFVCVCVWLKLILLTEGYDHFRGMGPTKNNKNWVMRRRVKCAK